MEYLLEYIKNYTTEHNIDYEEFINVLCKKKITTIKRKAEINGMRRGTRHGIYQNKIEVAKKLLAKNFQISEIQEITNLSLNLIKYLQN